MDSTTPGVVRTGDTVRRPYGPWVPTVQSLLRHLEDHDFPAPRPLGIDESGREVVTWLPGVSTWDEHARHWASSTRLSDAAKLVRRLHEVLDLFETPVTAVWRGGWGRPVDGTGPICHNDLAPYNVVISPNGSLGVIDWDGAGPGVRMAELAYAIDGFVLLRRDSFCRHLGWSTAPSRAERIEVFVQAYGLRDEDRPVLADALIHNARDRLAFGEAMYAEGREPWASWWAKDRGAGDREDLTVTETAVSEWTEGVQ